MLFSAVKQASGHGSKERRRALAETSDPFSEQTREWQTAPLHIKWRREERERERRGWERLGEAARGSRCRCGAQGRQGQRPRSRIPRRQRPFAGCGAAAPEDQGRAPGLPQAGLGPTARGWSCGERPEPVGHPGVASVPAWPVNSCPKTRRFGLFPLNPAECSLGFPKSAFPRLYSLFPLSATASPCDFPNFL